jgi:Family of unknown function (DUF5999)
MISSTIVGSVDKQLTVPEDDMCTHQPRCPDALAPDRTAARVTVSHPEQGWSLLCNGVVLFDDAGVLLPGALEMSALVAA